MFNSEMNFIETLALDTFRYAFFSFFIAISGAFGLAWSFLVIKTCLFRTKATKEPSILEQASNLETNNETYNLLSAILTNVIGKTLEQIDNPKVD
jgi:hypothetical protein